MFKLSSFLVVFVLAGLCFGASSEDNSSSGKEASSNAGGTGNEALSGSGGEITADNEDPSVSDSAAGGKNQEDKEQNGEASGGDSHKENQGIGTNTENDDRTLGNKLPDFIGGLDEKKGYVKKLLSTCSPQYQTHKINENEINFENCTYTCIRLTTPQVKEETRIPSGMTCGDGNRRCENRTVSVRDAVTTSVERTTRENATRRRLLRTKP
uniref:Putative ixodes 8-cys protein n=1 Tax=Ixodes ricinus TaxID=34613 RepID=A0A0K8R7V2_IXORI